MPQMGTTMKKNLPAGMRGGAGIHAEGQANNREFQLLVGQWLGAGRKGVANCPGHYQAQRYGRRRPRGEAVHQEQPKCYLAQRPGAARSLVRRVEMAKKTIRFFRAGAGIGW
jgi:hypothetical protein